MKWSILNCVVFVLAVFCLGCNPTSSATVMVVGGDKPMKYIEPLQDLPSVNDPLGWTLPGYNTILDEGKGDPDNGASGWQVAVYDVGEEGAILAADNDSRAFYTRSKFEVRDPSVYKDMLFSNHYSDGYVAWLNGAEIARSPNMEGVDPRWDSVPKEAHPPGVEDEPVTLHEQMDMLQVGENVFAAAAWATDKAANSLMLKPKLTLVKHDVFHVYLTWQGNTSTTMTISRVK